MIAAIEGAAHDPSPKVRDAAAWALSRISGQNASPP